MIEYSTTKGWTSFFYNFPRILFRVRGSIVVDIFPQIILAVALSIVASIIKPNLSSAAHTVLGVPLAFLVVFKSNLSYGQYWEGRGHVGNLVRASRTLCLQTLCYIRANSRGDGALAVGQDDENDMTRRDKVRVCRLIKLFYWLALEHCRDSGPGKVRDDDPLLKGMDGMIEQLTQVPGERDALGAAVHSGPSTRARPLLVLQWIMTILTHACDDGHLGPLRLANMDGSIAEMMTAFNGMDKIDKMNFPFPYAQLLKAFELLFVFTLPFVVAKELEEYTVIAGVCLCVAFYGIDEVGEILEDPFGTGPNDLPVDAMGFGLCSDIDMFVKMEETYTPAIHGAEAMFSPRSRGDRVEVPSVSMEPVQRVERVPSLVNKEVPV